MGSIGRNKTIKYLWLPMVVLIICLLLQGIGPMGSHGLTAHRIFHQLAATSSAAAQMDSRLAEYFRGITLYRAGQWAQAASIFEALLEKNPEFSLAAGAAADAYRKLERTDKAQSYYALAARLSEEKLRRRAQWGLNLDTDAVTADLMYYRYRMGQRDEAWALLKSIKPGNRENLAGPTAMLLFASGEFKKARAEFCRAFKRDPRDYRLLEFLAEARAAGRKLACPPKQTPEKPTRAHALIIGIGRYRDRGIAQLTHPVHDALCIDEALGNPRYSLFPGKNVVVLLDRQATTSAIRKELRQLGEKAADLVMIYFTGRTAWEDKTAYWLTHDTLLDRIQTTGLSGPVIANFLTRIQARRLAVFVDSRHSPASTRGASTLSDFFSSADERETVFITASTKAMPAGKLKSMERGVFSPYLCKVLQGKGDRNRDGLINIHETWSYMKNRAGQTGRDQALAIRGSYTEGFVISKNPLMR
ncbi:MAG: hypothetical protein JRI22_08340 [Deltaproteobacteria bacterium]|nr:hypothetical protein [Deltaproteobacteria bacterium]